MTKAVLVDVDGAVVIRLYILWVPSHKRRRSCVRILCLWEIFYAYRLTKACIECNIDANVSHAKRVEWTSGTDLIMNEGRRRMNGEITQFHITITLMIYA